MASVVERVHAVGSVVAVRQTFALRVVGLVPVTWNLTLSWSALVIVRPGTVVDERTVSTPGDRLRQPEGHDAVRRHAELRPVVVGSVDLSSESLSLIHI